MTAPTGAGKTALALELARQWPGPPIEIVAVDAFTVYRGLDIGTAKATAQERAEVPHHLLDIVEVTHDFDVQQFVQHAEKAIADILGRGHLPLLVGGNGFYLSALIRGLPLTPASDPALRRALEHELLERGLEALLAEVTARSPAEAERMQRNPRRILRALEVYRQTGRWPSEFGYAPAAHRYQVWGLEQPWEELEQRLRRRTRQMLLSGWPAEAQWLAQQIAPERSPRPTVWQALGYPEALQVAQGALSVETAEQKISLASRQYARRQLTWLSRQLMVEWSNRAQLQLGLLQGFAERVP